MAGTDEGQQAESTLDQDLKAAWDAMEEVEETEENNEIEETAPEAEGEEAGGEEAPDEEEGDEAEQPPAESEESEDEEEGEEPETAPTVEPPQDWPKEWVNEFAKLESDDARNLLVNQYKSFQADYTRKTQEIADVRKALEPIKQSLDLKGISEGQYVRQLAAADQYLSQNPLEGIKWLAQQYGVTPDQLGGQQSEDDEYIDPQVAQLKQEVHDLKNTLQQRERQQQESQQQSLEQQVQSFAMETDENGHLKRPHFEEVKTHMGGLLQAGAAQTLDEAYEQAVWARPDLREQLLAEQQRTASQKQEQERKQKATKARKAATPQSSGTTAEQTEEAKSLKDELERQWDQHTQ